MNKNIFLVTEVILHIHHKSNRYPISALTPDLPYSAQTLKKQEKCRQRTKMRILSMPSLSPIAHPSASFYKYMAVTAHHLFDATYRKIRNHGHACNFGQSHRTSPEQPTDLSSPSEPLPHLSRHKRQAQ
ncbi:hypothetical protein C1645_836050 [Glomus cerebriforme]|uniref:Uncharacterized protein n=1 Tax=Glomus cerebriforme TaxID=658196 RepID=A0A397SHM9_9GLOM|nr:hypothetical protein C1645_836050 [Glomus cerebriforme]